MNRIRKKFEYKYVIVAACFLMILTVLGFCSSSKSIYISAITEALSISRSAFSINDSCRYITTAVVNLFFGVLVSRFGERKLMAAGFISLIISCLLYSVGRNVLVFYLGGVFLGIGLSWTTTTMIGAVIGKWFKENRGTVMGAILAANGIGAAVSIQIISPIIYQENTKFGYQDAYRLVAVILLVVGAIVISFMRNNPPKSTEEKKAVIQKKSKSNVWAGKPFVELIKKPYFYCGLFCIFTTGMVLQGISGISAPLMRDVGLDEGYIATVLSVHSLALTFFKFGVGFSYDKLGLRKTATICFVASVTVMLMLLSVTNSRSGMILAMTYGIFSSLALPLETIMLPIFAGELFGENAYNKVLGIITSVNTAGYALGAPMANLCYDLFGTYNLALCISVGLMVVTTIIMQFVITAAKKERIGLKEIQKVC